jgi:hypothetical protein
VEVEGGIMWRIERITLRKAKKIMRRVARTNSRRKRRKRVPSRK